MKYKIEYLLKYITNETYQNILQSKNSYLLEHLEDNRRDVELNISYLLKYGITKTDEVVFNRIEELILLHNDFIKEIEEYEQTLSKHDVINMLENM